jgi:Tol biopolymer transport system component
MRALGALRGRVLFVSAALLILCSAAATWPDRAQASFPGENGRLVFTWYNLDRLAFFVFTVNDAGGDRDAVARCDHECSHEAGDWSPNGHRLVYVRQPSHGPISLVVSRPDGSDRDVIFQANGDRNVLVSPVWSPTGRGIAFTWIHFVQRLSRDVRDIFVIRRDGTHLRRITDSPHILKTGIDWSIQNRLVFSQGSRHHAELFKMRPDGSHLLRLTHNNVPDTEPDWAPGGVRLTFVRDGEIWTMRASGSDAEQIALGGSPAWAPNGSLIAFTSGADDDKIHTVEPSGQGEVSIGDPFPISIWGLDWQPR